MNALSSVSRFLLKATFIVLAILGCFAVFIPATGFAATLPQAIAAGQRAMAGLDPVRQEWLRTLPEADVQLVLCASLASQHAEAYAKALDCARAASGMTHEHVARLGDDWARFAASYRRQASLPYIPGVAPTDNDMARVKSQDRAAAQAAIGCERIRDKIAAQVFLMRSGSTGYWNINTMQDAERQYCGSNMTIVP